MTLTYDFHQSAFISSCFFSVSLFLIVSRVFRFLNVIVCFPPKFKSVLVRLSVKKLLGTHTFTSNNCLTDDPFRFVSLGIYSMYLSWYFQGHVIGNFKTITQKGYLKPVFFYCEIYAIQTTNIYLYIWFHLVLCDYFLKMYLWFGTHCQRFQSPLIIIQRSTFMIIY